MGGRILFLLLPALALSCSSIDTVRNEHVLPVDAKGVSLVPIQSEEASVPGVEGVPKVRSEFAGEAPRIDGSLADWGSSGWVSLTDRKLYEGENWSGSSDCAVRIAFMHDANHLYIGAEVTDDVFHQTETGQDIWKGDSFQLALDPWLDRTPNRYSGDDIEIGWAVTPDGNAVQVWRWTGGTALPGGPVKPQAAISRDGTSMVFEMALPFTELGQVSPGLLSESGLSFLYNDNDGSGREGFIQWTPGIGSRKDPSSFGLLEFGPAPAGRIPALAAQFKWIKSVTARGGNIELRLQVLASEAMSPAELRITRRNGEEVSLARVNVPVKGGQQGYLLQVDSSELPEGRCTLHIAFDGPGGYQAVTERSVYVYPPVRWVD